MGSILYPLASLEQIERTPSREDGIPEDLEEDLRAYGCKLIHQAGILLKQYVFTSHLIELKRKIPVRTWKKKKTGSCSHCSDSVSKVLVRHIDETVWCWGE